MDAEVQIPYNYTPRPYQFPAWQAFQEGVRRLLLVWHRRAGKDKTCLNMLLAAAAKRVGYYAYVFPNYAQGKKVLWDGIDRDGFRFLNHIPRELRDGQINNTEMKVRLWNGSLFQVLGAENYDSLMGTNPVGVVFSEFSLIDPRAWDYIRPILVENEGFAIFNGTPRGKHNHLYTLYQMAQRDEKRWFVSYLGAHQTGAISEKDIDQERKDGMDEETVQQEFYVSWNAGLSGAYYIRQIEQAERDKRIDHVPYDPQLPVHTWWDLGIGDHTVVVFVQMHLNSIRLIDCYATTGEGLPHYAKMMAEKPYTYGEHVAPHDIAVREIGTGRSRLEAARDLGITFKVARKLPIDDGISAVRMMLPQCWIDKTKCATLIEALATYRKEYDHKTRTYKDRPFHDWSSHWADAVRTGAVGRKRAKLPEKRERYVIRSHKHSHQTWMSA